MTYITETHQRKNKGKDTQKDPPIFITWATVAVQQEDWELWTHCVIVRPSNNDYRGLSSAIQVTKTGRVTIQNSEHICHTSITTEDHLCKQIRNHQGNQRIFLSGPHPKKYIIPTKGSVNTIRERLICQAHLPNVGSGKLRKILKPMLHQARAKLAEEIKLNKQCTSPV